jgi:DNA polymerase I-like protein with 3'-5' exonuclease and polymerase domains
MQFLARPIIAHLLLLRDIAKKEGVLRTDIDPDGRMRTSFNIAGTNTGRFSSSLSDFGTGTNLQNIEDSLRSVFVADPGMKFAYVDLEQAESRLVGAIIWNLFGDGGISMPVKVEIFIPLSANSHGETRPWTGDPRADKQIAEAPFYRQHSYRHMAKVLGHGTNYSGQPHTMALHTKIEPSVIKQFQANYFTAFPGIPRWHARVAQELRRSWPPHESHGSTTMVFGRRDDPATIREAVAYDPQGLRRRHS